MNRRAPVRVQSTQDALSDFIFARTRRSVRRALLKRALTLPLLVLLGVYIGYDEVKPLKEIGFESLVIPLLVFFLLVRLFRVGYTLRQSYRGSGIVLLTGDVLHTEEVGLERLFWRVADIRARWLVVDVRERLVMSPGNRPVSEPGGVLTVSTPRRIFRRAKERDDVVLACTPGHRAMERLDRGGW